MRNICIFSSFQYKRYVSLLFLIMFKDLRVTIITIVIIIISFFLEPYNFCGASEGDEDAEELTEESLAVLLALPAVEAAEEE